MYLTVTADKSKSVTVTYDKKDAKPFSVKTVNETLHRHELEFSLTSTLSKIKPAVKRRPSAKPLKKPTTTNPDDILPLEYMLEVVVNPITGKGGRSPVMRLSSDYQRTRLLLKKRSNHRISCDTKDWIKGTEAYYIQCIHPLAKGFLCVKARRSFARRQQNGQGQGRQQRREQVGRERQGQQPAGQQRRPVGQERPPGGGERQGEQELGGQERQGEQEPGGQERQGEQELGGQERQGEQEPGGQERQGEQEPGGQERQGERELGGQERQGEQEPGGQERQREQEPSGQERQGEQDPRGQQRQGERQPGGQQRQGEQQPGGQQRQGERQPGHQEGQREEDTKAEDQYKVCVKGISFAHSLEPEHFMLFRLQPAQL